MRPAFKSHPLDQLSRSKMIQLIHVKAGLLAMDIDTRRTLQERMVGKASCADMSEGQLRSVLGRFISLSDNAGLAKPKRRRPGRDERQPDEVATQEQLQAIELLFSEIEVRPSALMMNLCRRACGHPWAQTRADGNKIIEMLKSMRERGWRPTKEPLT